MGLAPALTTKANLSELWGVNTIERRAASHAYCQKRMFISNMFVVSVILVAIANGKTQGVV
jgi:hypothetical protein